MMDKFYRTDITYIDGLEKPCPEPGNWLGYKEDQGHYIVKTSENLDAEELNREEVRKSSIDCWKLFDQFI